MVETRNAGAYLQQFSIFVLSILLCWAPPKTSKGPKKTYLALVAPYFIHKIDCFHTIYVYVSLGLTLLSLMFL
jgi:hypothetical protein